MDFNRSMLHSISVWRNVALVQKIWKCHVIVKSFKKWNKRHRRWLSSQACVNQPLSQDSSAPPPPCHSFRTLKNFSRTPVPYHTATYQRDDSFQASGPCHQSIWPELHRFQKRRRIQDSVTDNHLQINSITNLILLNWALQHQPTCSFSCYPDSCIPFFDMHLWWNSSFPCCSIHLYGSFLR